MVIFVVSYLIWTFAIANNIRSTFIEIIRYVPFSFILFWPTSFLERTYELFRRVVIFFAIGSSIITILSYFGLTSYIPHYFSSAHSSLHALREDYYNIYFVFPELTNDFSLYNRACGMMEEPGHFSIVLGFVYLIDRYCQRKINPFIIVCAVLAFSPAFFLTFLFVEFVNIRKYFKKILFTVLTVCIAVFFIYINLPRNMQEMVYFLAYERNVEQLADTYNNTGSLDETLDERVNFIGKSIYDDMDFDDMLVGGKGDREMILSDYRGFIVNKGLIGLIIAIAISLSSLLGAPRALKISLFLTLFMIMLHRAWFFYEPFPYFMALIAVSLCKSEKLSSSKKQKKQLTISNYEISGVY